MTNAKLKQGTRAASVIGFLTNSLCNEKQEPATASDNQQPQELVSRQPRCPTANQE